MQGNPDIGILMIPTKKAIKKHVKDRDAFTEIYNRAYEAVMISMEAKEADINKLKAEIAEWEADAKRLIQLANFKNARAGEYFDLHEQLVKKYEVKK